MRKVEKFLVTFCELWDDDCTLPCDADFVWDADGVCDALRGAGAFPFPYKHDKQGVLSYWRKWRKWRNFWLPYANPVKHVPATLAAPPHSPVQPPVQLMSGSTRKPCSQAAIQGRSAQGMP